MSLNRLKFNEDDGNGDDNVKKVICLIRKRARSLFFLHVSLPSLRDHDVKFLYATFFGGRKPAHDNEFLSLLLNSSLVPKNSIPG